MWHRVAGGLRCRLPPARIVPFWRYMKGSVDYVCCPHSGSGTVSRQGAPCSPCTDKLAALSLPGLISRAGAYLQRRWPDWQNVAAGWPCVAWRLVAAGTAFLFSSCRILVPVMIGDPVSFGVVIAASVSRRAVPPFGFPQSMTLQSGRVRRKDNGLPAPFAACGGSRVGRSPPVSFRLFPRPMAFRVVRKTKERRNKP